MPRSQRIIEDNVIYHVLNRANGRMQIFDHEKDYLAFEKIIFEAKNKYPVDILSFCIMPNHWHFVLQSKEGNNLALFMRWLTLTHTQRWLINKNMVGYGHLYQGRYKSFPVQNDQHFLQLCQYVERNALRAGLTDRAESWRWGSAWIRKHGIKEQKELLSEWPIPLDGDYYAMLNQKDDVETLRDLRESVNRGKPFGSDNWIKEIANKFNLGSTLKLRGRPKKGT